MSPEIVGDSPIELMPQEIALDHPKSIFRFNLLEKQVVATPGALDEFGAKIVHDCLEQLRIRAEKNDGLDYLQVFRIGLQKKKLWIIEDGQVITALLPDEY